MSSFLLRKKKKNEILVNQQKTTETSDLEEELAFNIGTTIDWVGTARYRECKAWDDDMWVLSRQRRFGSAAVRNCRAWVSIVGTRILQFGTSADAARL